MGERRSTDKAPSLAVVADAPADARMAQELADRVLRDRSSWLGEQDELEPHRRWRGLHDHETHLEWHKLPEQARKMGIKAHGHFAGEPGAPDAVAARKALLLLMKASSPCPDGVILLRDSDGEWDRLKGLQQARSAPDWPFKVVLGMAHPKRESWVLAGYVPSDATEQERLESLKKSVGFDPIREAHTLKSNRRSSPDAKRDAKEILAQLTLENEDREASCWQKTPLAHLREHGAQVGLTTFLEEVEAELLPLFG